MRVTLLAGGIGGARCALGLIDAIGAKNLTIIANVGDDLEHWGLSISPDVDTLLYTLAGREGEHGWGVRGDTKVAMGVVAELGGPAWFLLGDADIGLHLMRTERLRAGEPTSVITADIARRFGIATRILPASDEKLRTRIQTAAGELDFQHWLVGRRAADAVAGVRFEGHARAAPGVLDAIADADRIVLAPSNPFVSLDPILAVTGIRDAIAARRTAVSAISPIIAGQAVKGPLAAMLAALGHEQSALGVMRYLAPLVGHAVIDHKDAALEPAITSLGLRVSVTETLMRDADSRRALAQVTLA